MTSFEKPTKKTRPGEIRKRERKRKDRELQQSIGAGICERCNQWAEQRTGHHKIARRNLSVRWDMENIEKLCYRCHQLRHEGK
jgi:5-methylcytosine-specific restriction endonuclease McrA